MSNFRTYVIALALATVGSSALASDAAVGRELARQCSVCHGRDGVSNDPEVPILAGQHAFYVEKSLKEYRDGIRQDRRMTLIAQPLTDEQISDLAAWFAAIKITAELPDTN